MVLKTPATAFKGLGVLYGLLLGASRDGERRDLGSCKGPLLGGCFNKAPLKVLKGIYRVP